ncbi:MAG: hypothetical protein HZC37_30670 [Burkholderiales bacterium]|nr:hypothetical protein [Burkholderiales bacterium]
MSEFNRDRLPHAVDYFESEGLSLAGRGRWRTAACQFHGGSDSLRINVESGAWICMNCLLKGGDVLAYHMLRHGLDFVSAARALGAIVVNGRPDQGRALSRRFSARDALEVVGLELGVCVVVIADAKAGTIPNDLDWRRFLDAVGRVETIAAEARA